MRAVARLGSLDTKRRARGMVLGSMQGRNQDHRAGADFEDVSRMWRLARWKTGRFSVLQPHSSNRKTRTYRRAKWQIDEYPYQTESGARNGSPNRIPSSQPG